jgi:hypothetical protein
MAVQRRFWIKGYEVEMRRNSMLITDPDGYPDEIRYDEPRVRMVGTPMEYAMAYIERAIKALEWTDS